MAGAAEIPEVRTRYLKAHLEHFQTYLERDDVPKKAALVMHYIGQDGPTLSWEMRGRLATFLIERLTVMVTILRLVRSLILSMLSHVLRNG